MQKLYKLTLELNLQQLKAFDQMLLQMPYYFAAPIIDSVKQQLQSQLNSPESDGSSSALGNVD